MSLLIGDDYPEAVEPRDRENPAPGGAPRGRPGPRRMRYGWAPWRGRRTRSRLIQDAPDPAEDEYGAQGGYVRDDYPDDRITRDRYPESGPADSGYYPAGQDGFHDAGYREPGRGDRDDADEAYPGPGYADTGYPGSRYCGPGYPDSGYSGAGHSGSGHSRSGRSGRDGGEDWYQAEPDEFRLPDADDGPWDDSRWDAGGEYEPEPEEDLPGFWPRPLAMMFRRREGRDRNEGGSRTFASSAQRLAGVLLAGASLVGVAVYVPSILAAGSRSFTGVVSNSGIASLNFGTSGRVGRILVHLGQVVGKGEVLATEAGAAKPAAVRADRAAITADQANLAALQADGSAVASVAAAQAQLAKDRARRAADRMKRAATEIVAPRSGTVIAIDGQPGETVSPAGLTGSAGHGHASPRPQPRFSLVPSGPMASLRAAGLALPVIALRTGVGWQVRLLIPQTDTSAVKAGGNVTISVPAARLSGVTGTIGELSPTPVTSSGSAAYEAVVQVPGRTRVTPLTGMTANVQLGS